MGITEVWEEFKSHLRHETDDERKYIWWVLYNISQFSLGDVLTADGSGGGGRMAPVTPDAGLPGAIDAHWVAPHLDKINGPGSEACQPT